MSSHVVVVAASSDNELSSKDLALIERLKNKYEIQFFYYLYKIPAEMFALPEMSGKVERWTAQGEHMLKVVGDKLGLSEKQRHLVRDPIGPDEVFDQAKALKAEAIITHDPDELKQRFLSRVLDSVGGLFNAEMARKVPVEPVGAFVSHVAPEAKVATSSHREQDQESPVHPSPWTAESERKLRGRGTPETKEQPDVEEKPSKKPRL